ncbi:helix-turn-helix domain-containing protein [Paracoccus sp. NSM]|uniref:helix-turn-helix domain-containing protein n=1 Tax=Paracoccus sp. NSM TaxID=3457784 RepID=UPI00403502AE
MSIAHIEAVFRSDLPPTQRLVMLALADHADRRTGQCFVSIERLERRTGLAERTIQNSIRALCAAGHLTLETRGGRGRANAYSVHTNPAADAPFEAENPAADAPFADQNPAGETPYLTTNPAADAPFIPKRVHLTTVNPAGDAPQPYRTNVNGADTVTRASVDHGLIAKLTHALGFDLQGIVPRYWASPDAALIVSRWQTDLGLTADEIIHIATANMRAHGAPANGPKVLTRHMQDYAAAKAAPALTPTPDPMTTGGNSYAQRPARRAADDAAAADRLRREVDAAVRMRRPTPSDMP